MHWWPYWIGPRRRDTSLSGGKGGAGRPNSPTICSCTLILVKNSEEEIINLKFLLTCFGAMPGLKINFDKSEALFTGGDLVSQCRVAHMMSCELGSIPIKYLGMPISNRALMIMDLYP
jgi:hypothetical protein